MSGKLYVCRVVREFGAVVDGAFKMHNVGDEVVRNVEPADASHLEVIREEDAPAAGLVVNPAEPEVEAAKAKPKKAKA